MIYTTNNYTPIPLVEKEKNPNLIYTAQNKRIYIYIYIYIYI